MDEVDSMIESIIESTDDEKSQDEPQIIVQTVTSGSTPSINQEELTTQNEQNVEEEKENIDIAKDDVPVIPKKPPPAINNKWLSTKALTEIKEFMGEEILQLLEMFEQETPAILNKMKIALKSRNVEEVQKMAHMLKSTSANIGANGLSFFSRKMELAANNREDKVLVPTYNKINKAYSLTSAEIKKSIDGYL